MTSFVKAYPMKSSERRNSLAFMDRNSMLNNIDQYFLYSKNNGLTYEEAFTVGWGCFWLSSMNVEDFNFEEMYNCWASLICENLSSAKHIILMFLYSSVFRMLVVYFAARRPGWWKLIPISMPM
jgi:hypothetical protein